MIWLENFDACTQSYFFFELPDRYEIHSCPRKDDDIRCCQHKMFQDWARRFQRSPPLSEVCADR